MTPTTPAQTMRDYLRDRLADTADTAAHPDRETLENLSLAVELLDALVAAYGLNDSEGVELIAYAAAHRLYGWESCTACHGMAAPGTLTGGVCEYCDDDDDRDDDEPCHLGHLDCAPWPDGPCANERREGRCFTCAEIAPPLNTDGDCAQCAAPTPHVEGNPFGGALDR